MAPAGTAARALTLLWSPSKPSALQACKQDRQPEKSDAGEWTSKGCDLGTVHCVRLRGTPTRYIQPSVQAL